MKNWTFKKPTEPGLYYVNLGRCVGESVLSTEYFGLIDGVLTDSDGCDPHTYTDDVMFCRVDVDELDKYGIIEPGEEEDYED